jgi:hypothetical protein
MPIFRELNEKNGLPSNVVNDINQDSNGFIWISTDRGLSKFDGYNFKTFKEQNGLIDEDIFSTYIDSKNRIWCLNSNGTVQYIQHNKIFTEKNKNILQKIHSNSWWTTITEGKNKSIYFGSFTNEIITIDENLRIVKKFSFQKKSIYDRIKSDAFLYKDKFHVFSFPHGLSCIDINKKDLYLKNKDILNHNKIIYDKFNESLISFYENRIFFHSLEYQFKDSVILKKTNKINFIKVYNENNILVGGLNGIYLLNTKLKLTKKISSRNDINKIFIDKDQSIWMITNNNGILIQINDNLKNIDPSESSEPIFSCKCFNDTCFMGSSKGKFYRLIKNSIYYDSTLNSLQLDGKGRIFGFEKLNDKFIVAYERKLAIKYKSKFYLFPIGTKSTNLFGNNLIIGYSNNLYKISANEINQKITNAIDSGITIISFKPTLYELLPHFKTNDIHQSSSELLTFTNRGVLKFEAQNNSIKTINYDPRFNIKCFSKFGNNEIIYVTSKGEIIYQGSHNHNLNYIFKEYENFYVSKIRTFDSKKIVICSNYGIFILTFGKRDNIASVFRFSEKDGLISNITNDFYKYKNLLFVLTDKGVTIIDENYFEKKNIISYKPVLHKISINGKIILDGTRIIEGNNRANISYGCLDFKNFRNVEFRYKLNTSDIWKYSGSYVLVINQLPRGNYNIEIQAKTPFNEWSKSLFLPPFQIIPPFWERAHVQGPILGASFLLWMMMGMWIFNVRFSKGNNDDDFDEAKLKVFAAQIRPHFLSNIFANARSHIAYGESHRGLEIMDEFGNVVRRVLENSEHMLISALEEMRQLRDYLKFESYRENFVLDYVVESDNIDSDFEAVMIPTMVIQPFVENSLMHGFDPLKRKEGRIHVHFNIFRGSGGFSRKDGYWIAKNGKLIVTVIDDGMGRLSASQMPKKEGRKSYGIRAAQAKINWVREIFNRKAYFEIIDRLDDDSKPLGTSVIVVLPLIVTKVLPLTYKSVYERDNKV